MNIAPDHDRSFVCIRDDRLAGCEWLLQLPEYGYGKVTLSSVRWEVLEAGKHLRYSWDDAETEQPEAGVAYRGEIAAGEDALEFRVLRMNHSPSAWNNDQGSLFCLRSAEAPLFHDIDGVRTYAFQDGIFQTVNQLVDACFVAHRMCRFPVRTAPGASGVGSAERLMAKISKDGRWVLGIATDVCGWLSCNHQPKVSCIHSNPIWGVVSPGGRGEARGKVYLLEQPIEALLARYRGDFET